MRGNPAQQAMDWMDNDGSTSSVLLTAKRLLAMQAIIAGVVPPSLASGFSVSQIQGTELTLTADNTAFSAKLRQLQPRIIEALARAGWNVMSMRLRVSANGGRPAQRVTPRQARLLEAADLAHFEAIEPSLRPGPLADAINRLLRHHKAR